MWKNEKEKKNNAKNEKKMAFRAITGMMLKKKELYSGCPHCRRADSQLICCR
jgi:hypothetical protein